jgi:small GTP-binding protein
MSLAFPEEICLKIVILGPPGVGKTSIIHRYCNGYFQTDTVSTIGAGFFTHTIIMSNVEVTLLLWDTAGEERFRSVAPSILHGANGMILVYDRTQPSSLEELNIFLEMFLDNVPVDVSSELPILLLGNKCDLEGEDSDGSQITDAAVATWCAQRRIVHSFSVSAKSGLNVSEAMQALVATLMTPASATEKSSLRLVMQPMAPDAKPCC